MKHILLAALFLLLPLAGSASDTSSTNCTLRIHAVGFRNQEGVAGAAVFTSPVGWPERKDKAYASDAFPISGRQALLTFHLPPGKYGVVVLHDENMNHKLDRNLLDVPTEGFGFANNPHVYFRAPPFKKAEVNVTCPVTDISVKMIYK